MKKIHVAIRDSTGQYHLLSVQRCHFDVYCFVPNLGSHFSLHESGKSHFRHEEKTAKPEEQPPVALIMGEAGTPVGQGIVRAPLDNIGRASGICTAIFSVDSLSRNFRRFNRSTGECFVIDVELFPKGTNGVEIGVWAVPDRNKISFEFNNPNIPDGLLYKVATCEPQIWIYARSFC